jgi:hypothetical protein
MHSISESWKIARNESTFRPEFLVTLLFGHRLKDVLADGIHPAALPGALRLCTGTNPHYTYHQKPLFFSPSILSEPSLSHEIIPQERRFVTSEFSVDISSTARFPFQIFEEGGTLCIFMVVDLAHPNIDISESIRLFSGQVTSSSFDRKTDKISLTAEDGEPGRSVAFPPGNITLGRDQFPTMPISIDGTYTRKAVLGDVTYPILCPQVDEGSLFYICDSTITLHSSASASPFTVFLNGEEHSNYTVVVKENNSPITDALNTRGVASFIQFSKKYDHLPFVMCSGFTGMSPKKHPILTLLEYGQYVISDEASSKLQEHPLLLSALVNNTAPVLDIVLDRLLPQTPYFGGFLAGEFQVFDLDGFPSGMHLYPGSGLYGLVSAAEGDLGSVYNAIDIKYHRNIDSVTDFDATRKSYLLDVSTTHGALQRELQHSEAIYGRRYITLNMPDIPVLEDPPDIVQEIAHDFLMLSSRQRMIYTYDCPFFPALKLPLNLKFYADGTYVRLLKKTYFRHKIQLTCSKENTI